MKSTADVSGPVRGGQSARSLNRKLVSCTKHQTVHQKTNYTQQLQTSIPIHDCFPFFLVSRRQGLRPFLRSAPSKHMNAPEIALRPRGRIHIHQLQSLLDHLHALVLLQIQIRHDDQRAERRDLRQLPQHVEPTLPVHHDPVLLLRKCRTARAFPTPPLRVLVDRVRVEPNILRVPLAAPALLQFPHARQPHALERPVPRGRRHTPRLAATKNPFNDAYWNHLSDNTANSGVGWKCPRGWNSFPTSALPKYTHGFESSMKRPSQATCRGENASSKKEFGSSTTSPACVRSGNEGFREEGQST